VAAPVAKILMPGKDPGGCLVTIIIGIAGALVGGFVGKFIGWSTPESFDLGGIFIATVGAVILLILFRLVCRRRGDRSFLGRGEFLFDPVPILVFDHDEEAFPVA